jgi:hypothetical protein
MEQLVHAGAPEGFPWKFGRKEPKILMGTPALGDWLGKMKEVEWPLVRPRGWEYAPPLGGLQILGNNVYSNCIVGETVVDSPNIR